MKCISTLNVKIKSSLKVKRCTLVIIGYKTSSISKESAKEEEQVPYNHVTFQEIDDLEANIKLFQAPKTLEDGGKL